MTLVHSSEEIMSVFRPEPNTAGKSRKVHRLVSLIHIVMIWRSWSLQDWVWRSSTSRIACQSNTAISSDAETGEILLKAGTVMTRSVIDSIAEHRTNGLNWRSPYIPNDSAVLTEPVELQKFKVVDPDRVVRSLATQTHLTRFDCNTSWHLGWNELASQLLAEGIGCVDDIDHLGNRS